MRLASPIAEEIRLRLADAWGEMGAAWGVAPAIARVHAYLMARQEPLTEREVREALGPEPSRGQPRARRGRGMGPRRARRGAAAGRAARAGRHGLHGDRRPLALVRARRRRAQGPRGRPDHRRPRARRSADTNIALAQHPGDAGPRPAPRLADDVPRVRAAVRPRGGPRVAASSRPSSSGPCACWARCPTTRSCASSSCSTACRTTTSSASSRRSAASRRRPPGARRR